MKNQVIKAKNAPKSKTSKSDKKAVKQIDGQLKMISEMAKITDAFGSAIDGKVKFSKVKEMFKKLHKEVKKSSKK